MYQSGLGGLGGRQQNYAYGLADFKIKEYMGTVTQADVDLLNVLAAGAAKARARSKRKGIGGAIKRVFPYVVAVAASIATAGAATGAAIAWAVGTTAAKEEYMKKKAKKQLKKAQKKGAATQAEIARLDAEIAQIDIEMADIVAGVEKDAALAEKYDAEEIQRKDAQKVATGEKLKKVLPFISIGFMVLRFFK